jgi:hypothetical protein
VSTNKYIWTLCLVIAVTAACNKTKIEGGVDDRLFRPVLKGALVSDGNWISVNLQKISGAVSYVVTISRDTFKTVVRTITTSKDTAYFDNLQWERLYQVRARAIAADTVKNSKTAELGSIKTARFPTILNTPTLGEVNDNAVKVSWTNSGAAVTTVKILKASDSSVVKTVTLTATDITNQYTIVSGLTAATDFIVYLYSGTSVRGWADFKTKAPLTGNIVDLRDVPNRAKLLQDTLAVIPDGSTVLLKRGVQYTVESGATFSKSVTIMSGDDLIVPDQAYIFCNANFVFGVGSNIGYVDFKDVLLRSDSYGAKYIINNSNNTTVGRISFENCRADIFRGILRLQTGTMTVNNFIVNKCIMDSLNNYGILTVDATTCKVDNILVQNSTFYKVDRLIVSKQNSTSLLIENCTMNELVTTGQYIVNYGATNVTNGIKINNCIIGAGKGGGSTRGVVAGGATAIEAVNNYKTSDYIGSAPEVPSLLSYPGASTALWQDPVNGNFKIKDNTFAGKASTGDPRWRP